MLETGHHELETGVGIASNTAPPEQAERCQIKFHAARVPRRSSAFLMQGSFWKTFGSSPPIDDSSYVQLVDGNPALGYALQKTHSWCVTLTKNQGMRMR